MTSDPARSALVRSDFDRCFVNEPADVAPTVVLLAVRRSLRRRRLMISLVIVVATVIISSFAVSVLEHAAPIMPRPDTAVPSQPASIASQPPTAPPPAQSPPSKAKSPGARNPSPKDRAPKLLWLAQGGYRDRAGLTAVGEQGDPFDLSIRTVEATVIEQLDPDGQHLIGGESHVGTDEMSVEVGKRFTWRTPGEPGEGYIEVAVTRPAPDARVNLKDNDAGLCPYTYGKCRPTLVSGTKVWTATLPMNGFVIDLVQGDGEIASIIVRARASDSSVPLSELPISPEQAVSLLRNHDLDVVG